MEVPRSQWVSCTALCSFPTHQHITSAHFSLRTVYNVLIYNVLLVETFNLLVCAHNFLSLSHLACAHFS